MSIDKENRISLNIFKDILKNSWRTIKIIWPEKKGIMVLLIFLVLMTAGLPFLQSGSRALVINELIEIISGALINPRFYLFLGIFLLANFLPQIVYAIQNYSAKIFWFFLEEKFEFMILKRRAELDVAHHESPKHKDLLNKISEGGVYRIQNFTDRQFYILESVIQAAIAAIVLIIFKWWLFLIVLVGTLPEFIIEARYGRYVWGIYSGRAEVRRRFWNLRGHFEELSRLVELKIFQNIYFFLSTIKELFQNFRNEEKKNERVKLKYQLLSICLSQAVMAFAMLWFIWEVIHKQMAVGTLTFALSSLGDLRQSLANFFMSLGRQYQDSLFVNDVFKFIDIKPAVKNPKVSIPLNVNKTPEIIFDDVTFKYPGTDKIVLKNFSLKITPGEKIALVGRNGAGKTTFVKLLCRFYDPQKGRILIDGHNLKDIDLETWYVQLGALFQDYAHYHFIVKEAIAIGRTGKGTSMEKVKEAARASEADIFIEEWEKGYEQMLGKEFTEGIEPSIGQWQKLALARTFYRDPRVLILDEPTSSIDAEAEAKIFGQLKSLPKDRTVILISHRFSTVRQANRIVVIDDGLIREIGAHEELLELDGIYARLFNLQAKGYR